MAKEELRREGNVTSLVFLPSPIAPLPAMIDLIQLQTEKGGDPEVVRASQKKRNADPELVDKVLALYKQWTKANWDLAQLQKQINALQKQIGAHKKAKQESEAAALVEQKSALDGQIPQLKTAETQAEAAMRKLAATIGNIVHESVPVSATEDDNKRISYWHPEGLEKPEEQTGLLSHHEIMFRLDAVDQDRGVKVAGHRGYFLVNDGVDLNHALIAYGLDFLRQKQYKKIMTPFMMKRTLMAKTAQLEEFDESLYKLEGEASSADAAVTAEGTAETNAEDEKYLIATSEQPLSGYHSDEWFDDPSSQLPLRYAGYSTCFRKEAGKHGRETWGIFRVHQFEKVEQFCITDPASSWAEFDSMVAHSEEFYQSLKLPYQVVAIVSGALNNAAAKKYDLEAWFPYQKEFKELVSVSNCTDYRMFPL